MNLNKCFDVIVIGAGHAGTEAAAAAARMGAQTLLLTHNLDLLGQMSCNPAIGGIGKGHLVKEIDALDGVMARAIDQAGIQFRTLNASKGPAVRATRAQADRVLYRKAIRQILQQQENLTLFQQVVEDLLVENGKVVGVKTQLGLIFRAKTFILTAGTFLRGRIHVGEAQSDGGRAGDPPATSLADCLRDLNLPVGRLKTGTPPRINGNSIDYSVMAVQHGDDPRPVFSYMSDVSMHPTQLPCHITHTTLKTKEIIEKNLHRSPMYQGVIEGIGPRYCPSIEDKIVRFSEKPTHQIFVEPEGLTTAEVYPNGISTSLPFDVQVEFVRSIKGFENAQITRPGYAIEYDYFDPRGLNNFLQTKVIDNLFFAGQINGTTGYEEAAAQGLIAGINAALYVFEKPLFSLKRNEAYIGVLIDDLITLGTTEPYRMFTSRAEYRLLLREDNADLRLTEAGYKIGVVGQKRFEHFSLKQENLSKALQKLDTTWVRVAHSEFLKDALPQPLSHDCKASELLKRPEIKYDHLLLLKDLEIEDLEPQVKEQVEIQNKYQGYIERQQMDIEKLAKNENIKIPENFDYTKVSGLSLEVVQKLNVVKPASLAQAKRISGITPAALSLLLVHLKKEKLLA